MTFDEFKQIPPSGSEILLFFENTSIGLGNYSYTVKAVNVDVTPCNTADGKNITELAETAAHMSLDINYSPVGGDTQQVHTTYIQEREAQDGYYYFKIDPFTFTHDDSDIAQVSSCAVGTGRYFALDGLIPDVIRENDDENVIMNNVQSTPTSGDDLIMKVIYSNNSILPSNLTSILTGSAEKSDVQLYNYKATGLKRGRYEGSKTNENNFGGIPPALGLTSFRGAAYHTPDLTLLNPESGSSETYPGTSQDTLARRNREAGVICSQSLEERPMKTYYFSHNIEFVNRLKVSGIEAEPEPNLRTIPIYRTKHQFASESVGYTVPLGINSTEFSVAEPLDIEVGDVLAFSYFHSPADTNFYENVYVTSVDFYSASLDGPILQTTASVARNYLEQYDSNTAKREWGGSNFVSIHKYVPDTVYAIDEAQPYKVKNKRIWVQSSEKIFYVDANGQMVALLKEC